MENLDLGERGEVVESVVVPRAGRDSYEIARRLKKVLRNREDDSTLAMGRNIETIPAGNIRVDAHDPSTLWA